MPLDPTQQQKLTGWMAQKGVRPECPACGAAAGWAPGDIVAEMQIKPSGLHIGEPVTPLVQVVCNNCGHVMLFAAEPIGLYESRQKNCK
jgi:predicted RNA-binding Zn-ribbon protein involved in translation (DUF1610 family)